MRVLLDAHVGVDELDDEAWRAYKLAQALAIGKTGQGQYVRSLKLESSYNWVGNDSVHPQPHITAAVERELWSCSAQALDALANVSQRVQTLHLSSRSTGALLAVQRALERGDAFPSLRNVTLELKDSLEATHDGTTFRLGRFIRALGGASVAIKLDKPDWQRERRGVVQETVWPFVDASELLPCLSELKITEPRPPLLRCLSPTFARLKKLSIVIVDDRRCRPISDTLTELATALNGSAIEEVHLILSVVFQWPTDDKERIAAGDALAAIARSLARLQRLVVGTFDIPLKPMLDALPTTLRHFEWDYQNKSWLQRSSAGKWAQTWQLFAPWLEAFKGKLESFAIFDWMQLQDYAGVHNAMRAVMRTCATHHITFINEMYYYERLDLVERRYYS